MNEIKDRYARAEAVYRTQLSRRRGQNEGRISTASKERSVLKDANRSAHDQLSHELKEREKQMLGEAEVKKKELAARHAKQIADLLEAQEAVKKALAKDQETQLAVARREGRGQLIELGQSNKGKKEALEERLVEQKVRILEHCPRFVEEITLILCNSKNWKWPGARRTDCSTMSDARPWGRSPWGRSPWGTQLTASRHRAH